MMTTSRTLTIHLHILRNSVYVKLLESAGSDVLKLDAGVVISGKYEQDKSWEVEYAIDESLFATHASKNGFKLLPSEYYTVTNESVMVVPKGEIVGRVTFNINKELFMKDALALESSTTPYAIPLKIVKSQTDQVMEGKDYTIIKLSYFNKYHGNYYLTGTDTSADGTVTVYKKDEDEFVKNNRVELRTIGERELSVPYVGLHYNMANYSMKFTVSEDGNTLAVSPLAGSKVTDISGTGTITYSGKDVTMNVSYRYKDVVGVEHTVEDVLYFSNVSNNDLRVSAWEVKK